MYDCSYSTEPSKENLNSHVGNTDENTDTGYKTVLKNQFVNLKNIPVNALPQTIILTLLLFVLYKKKSRVMYFQWKSVGHSEGVKSKMCSLYFC